MRLHRYRAADLSGYAATRLPSYADRWEVTVRYPLRPIASTLTYMYGISIRSV